MAGQPKTRERVDAVNRFLGEKAATDEISQFEWVENYTASGGTLVRLAVEITEWAKLFKNPVRREHIRKHLLQLEPDTADERLARARIIGGEALIERTEIIAETEVDGQRAKARVEAAKTVAGMLNPALKDSGKQVNIAISMGAEHLAALRRRRDARAQLAEPGPLPKQLPSQVVDAQEVSVEQCE